MADVYKQTELEIPNLHKALNVSCQASGHFQTMTMGRIFILIIVVIFLTNCNNSQPKSVNKNDRLELVPEPDKHQRLLNEATQKLRKLNCDFLEPDTSLCGLSLRNSKSSNKVIGTENKIDEKQQYHFYSNFDSETLTLTQHPGDSKNQISVFSVTYSDKAYHSYKQLNFDTFKTEKGIKLGMSKKDVVERLGNCYVTIDSTKDLVELYYRIENPKDTKTKLLSRNNMPVYYATYGFWKDELKQFEFGFEYP